MAQWALLLLLQLVPIISALTPIVIIPGDGSNQLEAKLDKATAPAFYCSKKDDWYRLWLNTVDLIASTTCWCDNIRLVVNETTGFASNVPGVQTRAPYWGSTEGFEELDPSIPGHATAAFRNMVIALENAGYKKNVTLRGAPYDFRYTPDSREISYMSDLKALIEATVSENGGAKITIITHSMGGLHGLYFLRQQTTEWKNQHVAKFVPISAPWVGAAKEARLFATGDNEGIPGVSASKIRDEQRSYETNHWLYPAPKSPVWADQVLVTTPTANYTASDTDSFFQAINYPVGSIVHKRVAELLPHPETGPGVEAVCLYSSGVDTIVSFNYTDGNFDKTPKSTLGDGDGTVNLRSLRVCDGWNSTQDAEASIQTFSKISHSDMIMDMKVINAVLEILGLPAQ